MTKSDSLVIRQEVIVCLQSFYIKSLLLTINERRHISTGAVRIYMQWCVCVCSEITVYDTTHNFKVCLSSDIIRPLTRWRHSTQLEHKLGNCPHKNVKLKTVNANCHLPACREYTMTLSTLCYGRASKR